jgi:hypothetical protein
MTAEPEFRTTTATYRVPRCAGMVYGLRGRDALGDSFIVPTPEIL